MRRLSNDQHVYNMLDHNKGHKTSPCGQTRCTATRTSSLPVLLLIMRLFKQGCLLFIRDFSIETNYVFQKLLLYKYNNNKYTITQSSIVVFVG